MHGDTNFKGSDSSGPSAYLLFCGVVKTFLLLMNLGYSGTEIFAIAMDLIFIKIQRNILQSGVVHHQWRS